MLNRIFLAAIAALSLAAPAQAKLTAQSVSGFSLVVEGDVTVSPQQAYDSFVNIGGWWDMAHSYSRDGRKMHIELKPGGTWHEFTPGGGFVTHMEVAHAVDVKFRSGFRHGIETDRGFAYLKYGQPDDIEGREDEPSAPPYEIWIYYDFPFTKQKNVKFLFYNPSLAPGEFRLLHSTALGELNNPQWELELYRDAPDQVDGDAFDSTSMKDNFNRSAKRIMNDF
jgi:hypothetical protein